MTHPAAYTRREPRPGETCDCGQPATVVHVVTDEQGAREIPHCGANRAVVPDPDVEPWLAAMDAPETITVYVGIGNSDDKLSQGEWASFVTGLRSVADVFASQFLGEWYSLPDRQWQNCEMAWIMPGAEMDLLREELAKLRTMYRQDSIALAIVHETEFI